MGRLPRRRRTIRSRAPINRLRRADLGELCGWLSAEIGLHSPRSSSRRSRAGFRLTYIFLPETVPAVGLSSTSRSTERTTAPSISARPRVHAADWHEREAEDLFGLTFEGHPRLGEFVLHEDWPRRRQPDAPKLRRDAAA